MRYLQTYTIIAILLFGGYKVASKGASSSAEPESGPYSQLQPENCVNSTVFQKDGKFAGWPANNGVWIWDGGEILVGFTVGPYEVKSGHNLGEPHSSLLARSKDGGLTWESFDPDHFIGDGDGLKSLDQPIDTRSPDFALRVTGIGYHGNELSEGGFYYSMDRGRTWKGPFRFKGIESEQALDTMELTPRTDYLVENDGSLKVFISARIPEVFGSDRLFCAESKDGGTHFKIRGWVIPLTDPFRGVMSSTVRCSGMKLVSSVRRRDIGTERCWIDAFVSTDDGDSWMFLSKIGDTGPENGNPPALLMLRDGRLVCAYGQRERRQIIARISENEGRDWGPEIVLRDDFQTDKYDNADLGYPRMVQRADGKVVTIYYWATVTMPEQQIAVTIWDPDKLVPYGN